MMVDEIRGVAKMGYSPKTKSYEEMMIHRWVPWGAPVLDQIKLIDGHTAIYILPSYAIFCRDFRKPWFVGVAVSREQ